ncbi:hypothetical protein NDU88_002219 [Pleurodeles waltl]|uniref:Uncharacterized protein n=1 Tax=Pleurodeles waltl TaxID=8319 RepID=A0AAV7W2Q8_PLEWA|nr:hypothetical protein NDU88_002219 [Pleurodeles waltl]
MCVYLNTCRFNISAQEGANVTGAAARRVPRVCLPLNMRHCCWLCFLGDVRRRRPRRWCWNRFSVSKETRVDAGTEARVGVSVSLETLTAVPSQGRVRKQPSPLALALARKSNKKF